jgi:dTDP-4-dehydrorhamnose reductase
MKVYILGSNGMLGKYVNEYLSIFFEVKQINRDLLDASNQTEESLLKKLTQIGVNKNDVIINCMGTIKPRVDQLGDLNAILVNSVFPRLLSNVCEQSGYKLIHPTTDCVYSGEKGQYSENDKYDVSDVYGMSKAIGEPTNCTVIRTSIIGEEVNQGRSLVEWVKSNRDNEVYGFTNHKWNGVTCLEFAKICKKIIEGNMFWLGTKHLFSNVVTKQQLVEIISSVYDLNITVNPKETEIQCDRSLTTLYSDNLSYFNIPDLRTQIIEMKEFSSKLYNIK